MENLDESVIKIELTEEMKTVGDVMRYLITVFDESEIYCGHGAENSFEEAKMLLCALLNLRFDELGEFYQSRLTKREKAKIAELTIKRISERIPTAYLTHVAWFCDIPFYVDERVIIPRSPIAELIRNKFEGYLPKDNSDEQKVVLDLCTGSGCIAIATALQFNGEVAVDAVDISQDAIEVCYSNVYNTQMEELVTPIVSDLFEALEDIKYDLIVCNPPYVDQEDLNDMPEEFMKEPGIALGSGENGLDLTIKILREAPNYMKDGAYLICEVGNSMVHLMELYPDFDFNFIDFKNGGVGVFSVTKEQLLSYEF